MAVAAVVPFIEDHSDIGQDLPGVIRNQHPIPNGTGRNAQSYVLPFCVAGLVRFRRERTPKNKQTKSYQKGRALAMWRAGVLPPHELTAPSEWSYHADSGVSNGRCAADSRSPCSTRRLSQECRLYLARVGWHCRPSLPGRTRPNLDRHGVPVQAGPSIATTIRDSNRNLLTHVGIPSYVIIRCCEGAIRCFS